MSVQRKSSPSPTSPAAESDLETTAELPVLDVAAYEAATAEERLVNTDTWITQSPVASTPSAAVAAVGVAAPASVADESRDLDDRRLHDDRRTHDEKRANLEAGLHALSDNLREVEERLKHKGERLAQIEQALVIANADRAVAEQRSQQLTAELAKARTAVAVAEARVTGLQNTLEEREAANRALRSHDEEFEEKLALRDKALALVQRDLTASHDLAATYLESLQSMEGRRSIFQDLTSTLYQEIDERDARLGTLDGQLTAAKARVSDLESSLSDRAGRITKLEKELRSLDAAIAQRDGSLRETTRSGDELKRSVSTLTETLAARDEHIRALQTAGTQQSGVLAERQTELERVTAERTTLMASVNTLESKLATATGYGTERDAAARAAQSRCEEIEAAATAQRKRSEQLESELATIRAELLQRTNALQESGIERTEHMARIAAGEARAKELELRIDEQQEFVRVLQADSNASVARATELEGDLRAAEDMIHRLETDLRGRSARLDELEKTNHEWRATVEEARHALTDRDSLIRRLEEETANSAVLLGAIQQRLESTGTHEIAPDGDKRLLIRSEGDSDVVHVLGRKTSVGRTPDNDLQIDAKFISRHHAVILAGPAHTIIEDLNSTNGVLVNGRRITRQTLKDGDSVMIGKTVFRFAVRPGFDRRNN
ncbi:MAG TPA: FHA domain-containing protein [Steroidobacteraceae bacterium]|nr:FHA domain-containing protein [Steroidobacteraceae bacterium]